MSKTAGVDVSIGELRETYTKTMTKSKVTGTSWKRKVAELVGKVNSGGFKGWNAGEVMFLGCSYTAPTKGSKKVSVSFHFAIRLNESNATVAGEKIGNKKGFEYLWALTDDEVKDGARVRKIRKIYKAEGDRYGTGSLNLLFSRILSSIHRSADFSSPPIIKNQKQSILF